MKKNLIKKILCVAMSITILATTNVAAITQPALQTPTTRDASTASYYAIKIGDVENWATTTPAIAKGYYQYKPNNAYDKDGLEVNRSVVNILFVANCWADGSYKWLNDAHTKIQVSFGGKTFVFTDGSYYYTSNGTKKPLTVAFATKTKPKANQHTAYGGQGITDSRYKNILNASDHVFD